MTLRLKITDRVSRQESLSALHMLCYIISSATTTSSEVAKELSCLIKSYASRDVISKPKTPLTSSIFDVIEIDDNSSKVIITVCISASDSSMTLSKAALEYGSECRETLGGEEGLAQLVALQKELSKLKGGTGGKKLPAPRRK